MTPLRKLPFLLLALMTLVAFPGPFLIGWVLQGGTRPNWPPDRPVEWLTFLAIVALVAALMLACLALGLLNRRDLRRNAPAPDAHRHLQP
jgi:hypothetical protein